MQQIRADVHGPSTSSTPPTSTPPPKGQTGHLTTTTGTQRQVTTRDNSEAIELLPPITEQPRRSSHDLTQEMQTRVHQAITDDNNCCQNLLTKLSRWWRGNTHTPEQRNWQLYVPCCSEVCFTVRELFCEFWNGRTNEPAQVPTPELEAPTRDELWKVVKTEVIKLEQSLELAEAFMAGTDCWHDMMETTVRIVFLFNGLGYGCSNTAQLITSIWDHKLDGSNGSAEDLKSKVQQLIKSLRACPQCQ